MAGGGEGGRRLSGPTLLEAAGEAGSVLTASCGPLREADRGELRRKLRALREAFRFVKFGDNPRARAAVSPWAAAALALDEGLEPVVHVTCRDRNRLALEADLLGGRVLGVRHVLCLRGDEIEDAEDPAVRPVRDTDVVELLGLAGSIDQGFVLLAAADPAAAAGPRHAARLREKVSAGAAVLETQPVFDAGPFRAWLSWLRASGVAVPVLVDVFVLGGRAEVERVRRIPGIGVPEHAGRRVAGPRGGIRLAAELVRELRELDGVLGCHLSTLTGDPRLPLGVVEELGSA